jgi:DNA polymerase (family X)
VNDKHDIAGALREIGLLLQLQGENPYRAKAYETGARAVEGLREELALLVAGKRLTDASGIGPALAATIGELVTTGQSALLERLRQEVPPGALELSQVPGVTLKRIQQLQASLGIDSVATLKAACLAGQLREVKGFGEKTQATLLEAIERWEKRAARVLLLDALAAAEPLQAYLAEHPAAAKVELAGSLRRWRETVGDIDVVVQSAAPDQVIAHLEAYPAVARTLERRADGASVQLAGGLTVELHVAGPADYATTLVRATGSASHVARLDERARRRGVDPAAPAASEREVYERLALPFIAPELREDVGELADDARLADDLIAIGDIRGMTHCHTLYSDGRNSVEEMVRAAEAMGMEYLTITDHSPAAHYAGGVTLDRLKQQWDEIARVQETTKMRLLRGTESDILEDGALDYPDKVLEQFDVIIASIHSRMKMDAQTMTRRLERAMRQPVFKIWGHALGRMIGSREPFACDVERILDVVAESRAAVEINGDPHRLDLAPEWVRRARTRGIRFVVSTDAHSTANLQYLRYGVHTARRGWVRRGEVLNTLSADEFAKAVRPAG